MKVPVRINSQGLRADVDYVLEKPSDTYRLLVLGDSMTFGFGVKREETFPSLLEGRLNLEENRLTGKRPVVEVVNAGIGNYNTEQEFAYFKEKGADFRPDEVLLAFYVNDLEPPQNDPGIPFLRRSIMYPIVVSAWKGRADAAFSGLDFVSYYKGLFTRTALERYDELVEEFVDFLRRRGVRFAVVLVPELRRLKDRPFEAEYKAVEGIFAKRGVPVLDVRAYFDENADGSAYCVSDYDAHPNERAHRIMAEAIFDRFFRAEDPSKGSGKIGGEP